MLYEYYFQGRKPSIKQVQKQIDEGLRQNCNVIEISWGENMLTLQRLSYDPKTWYGSGWIKGISGHGVAEGLNRKQFINTMNLWNT